MTLKGTWDGFHVTHSQHLKKHSSCFLSFSFSHRRIIEPVRIDAILESFAEVAFSLLSGFKGLFLFCKSINSTNHLQNPLCGRHCWKQQAWPLKHHKILVPNMEKEQIIMIQPPVMNMNLSIKDMIYNTTQCS